jgi:WD40 repeat protein
VALSIAYSLDGSLFLAGSPDEEYTIRVWRTYDGALLKELSGHQGRVSAITFNPDGTRFASADDSGKIIVWRIRASE